MESLQDLLFYEEINTGAGGERILGPGVGQKKGLGASTKEPAGPVSPPY